MNWLHTCHFGTVVDAASKCNSSRYAPGDSQKAFPVPKMILKFVGMDVKHPAV